MESYQRLIDLIAIENLQMRLEHWLLTRVLVWTTLCRPRRSSPPSASPGSSPARCACASPPSPRARASTRRRSAASPRPPGRSPAPRSPRPPRRLLRGRGAARLADGAPHHRHQPHRGLDRHPPRHPAHPQRLLVAHRRLRRLRHRHPQHPRPARPGHRLARPHRLRPRRLPHLRPRHAARRGRARAPGLARRRGVAPPRGPRRSAPRASPPRSGC